MFVSTKLVMLQVYAETDPLIAKQPIGRIKGLGLLGEIIDELFNSKPSGGLITVAPAANRFAQVLSMVIGIITIVTGIWFMIKILIAGLTIISSSGDKNKMQEAQSTITNSIIGLTVTVAAYALTSLFGKILGIPNILDVGTIIQQLGPKIP